VTDRTELIEKIEGRKRELGLSWREIAGKIGDGSPVLYTAALKGQMTLSKEEASKAAAIFGLNADEEKLLSVPPYRGAASVGPPSDPLIYRFHELVQVYGTTWKALIEEEFGDGIMSAIDFDMTLVRPPDPKGIGYGSR
jgi:cyanate lyase